MWTYSYFSDNFHAVDLIKLVEQQPVLWNTFHANHSNKQVRNKAWESLAQKIVRNWNELPDKEKFGCLAEIKSKWKNIRDTFIKEKKMRLKNKGRTYKKRKYIYTDMLQFLDFPNCPDNFLEGCDESKDEPIQDPSGKEEPNDSNTETDEPQLVESPTFKNELSSSDCESSNDDPPPTRNILFVDSTIPDEAEAGAGHSSSFVSSSSTGAKRGIEEVSRNDDDGGDDPDKMFLLSMLPLFKNLSEHSKILARIQLTQVLQKLLYPKKS